MSEMPTDTKDSDDPEGPEGPEDSEAKKPKKNSGSKLEKIGEDLQQEDLIKLANELADFYKLEENAKNLSEAGITFKPSSKEDSDKKDDKQIGQIVVSKKQDGLPDKDTPLIIFSSNSIQAPRISGEGLDMARIEKIQQEHFINFLKFQANKANNNVDDAENVQPITIEAVGFSPESLNKLLDEIEKNPDIAKNIRIELPALDKCVHGDGNKYTKEEYEAAQQRIKGLLYTAPLSAGNPASPDNPTDGAAELKEKKPVNSDEGDSPKSPKHK